MHPHLRRTRARCAGAAALSLLSAALPALAMDDKQVLGWVEWGYLEPAHASVRVKLDTGARTSSVHAEDIEAFERDGEDWVRFRVPLGTRRGASRHDRDIDYELPVERTVLIKQHGRESLRRYVVEMELCLAGEKFATEMTLADRTRFNYPVLLGRAALAGRALVDAERRFLAPRPCPD